MELGMFLLRVVVGALFVGHGAQKLFGWFGGGGREGTGQFLTTLGYRSGATMATVAGATELAAGALLVFGFLTPLATAMVVGVMVNAIGTAHAGRGLWATDGGYEYPLVLIASAVTITMAGPGAWSIDAGADIGLTGTFWGLIAAFLGVGTGALVLATRPEMPEVVRRDEARRAA